MGTASLAPAHVGRRRCYDDPVGVHPATQAYQVAATSYERSRPGYAPDAVAALVEALRITPGTRVVDVGAGTGKLTRQLLGTGARIVAVEPVAAMREQFRAVLPDVEVLQGSAEALPLPDGSVDVVVAGQAWHWFDPSAALGEVTRVVVSGGGIALLWYDFDDSAPGAAWAADLRAVRDRRAPPDLPDPRSGNWRQPFDANPRWTPLQARHFRHQQALSRDGVVGRLLSSSCIAVLPPEEQEAVRREVLSILDRHRDIAGRGELVLPYRTVLFWARRV